MLTSTGNHLLPVNASPARLSRLQGNKGWGGLGEVMALMGGAVAGDREEVDWKRRWRRRRRGADGREVAGRMSSSAGGESVTAEVTCTVDAQQPTLDTHMLNMLLVLKKELRTK